MAVPIDKKLGIAVAALVGLGGLYYFQQKKQKEELATYTAEGRSAELPKIGVTEDQTKAIDKVVIKTAAGDAGPGKEVTLEKQGDKWMVVTGTVKANANETNVKSLLDNLKSLEIREEIDSKADAYGKYGLSDDKALHVVFHKGGESVADLYFGDSGTRGQMTRLAGKEGVYSVKGYSSYLYDREIKDWRDRTLLKFEEDKVKAVDITNEHGTFAFAKDGDKWTAKFKKAKTPMAVGLAKFDEAKVKDAVRAFKALNADGFGEGKTKSEAGLETPAGTITFTLDDGAKKTLHFGGTAEGTSRWAQLEGNEELVSVGSWAADWALANIEKFQETDKDKEKGGDMQLDMPGMGMPPGMQGMPPGMGDPHQ